MPTVYRSELQPCQIYTRLPRQEFNKGVEKTLGLLSANSILKITHRPNANLPIFSANCLKHYLSRYGEVEAALQISYNSFLVVFGDEHTARMVAEQHDLGAPHGRMLTKICDPTDNKNWPNFYHLAKLLEKSCDTVHRFSSLVNRHDIRAKMNHKAHLSRHVVFRTKGQGYNAKNFFCPTSRQGHNYPMKVGEIQIHVKQKK